MSFPLPAAIPLPIAFLDMIGTSELLVIFLLVLIFFGGEKMPHFARGLGKALREFRKATSSVEQEIKRAMEEEPPPPKTPVAHPSAVATTPTILPPQSAASAAGLAPAASPAVPRSEVPPATGGADAEVGGVPSPRAPVSPSAPANPAPSGAPVPPTDIHPDAG